MGVGESLSNKLLVTEAELLQYWFDFPIILYWKSCFIMKRVQLRFWTRNRKKDFFLKSNRWCEKRNHFSVISYNLTTVTVLANRSYSFYLIFLILWMFSGTTEVVSVFVGLDLSIFLLHFSFSSLLHRSSWLSPAPVNFNELTGYIVKEVFVFIAFSYPYRRTTFESELLFLISCIIRSIIYIGKLRLDILLCSVSCMSPEGSISRTWCQICYGYCLLFVIQPIFVS